MENPSVFYRIHAVQCLFERKISAKKVRAALEAGEVIEDYSTGMPEPSKLVLRDMVLARRAYASG